MLTYHITDFIIQFRRFSNILFQFIWDIFKYDSKNLIKIAIYGFLGPTLQAAALGFVFYLVRAYEVSSLSSTASINIADKISLPILVVIIAIFMLLLASVYVLYQLDRLISIYSANYANDRAGKLITYYPNVAAKNNKLAIDKRTGMLLNFVSDVKINATKLKIAAKSLLKLPAGFLVFLYGIIIIIYVNVLLSTVLLLFLVFSLIPLRYFTRNVTRIVRKTSNVSRNSTQNFVKFISDTQKNLLLTNEHKNEIIDGFKNTDIAKLNKLYSYRRVNVSRAKAIANILLTITVTISLIYFLMSESENISLDKIVLFFIGLRLASTGGKKIIAYVTKFSRFYNGINDFICNRNYAYKRYFPDNYKLSLDVKSLQDNDASSIKINRGQPIGILSKFDIGVHNACLISNIFKVDKLADKGNITDSILYIANPVNDSVVLSNTRIFDPLDIAVVDFAKEKIKNLCEHINLNNLENGYIEPKSHFKEDTNSGRCFKVEATLLGACLSKRKILVIDSEIFDEIPGEQVSDWLDALSHHYILTLYKYNGDFCKYLEKYTVVMDANGVIKGIAETDWFRNNLESLHYLFDANNNININSNNEQKLDDIYDDDEDDEDE